MSEPIEHCRQGHDIAQVGAQTLPQALEWLWQGYKPAK
jgi:hypothetical protein